MRGGSTRVVYAALAGNVAIAVSKVGAFVASGSSAMLTEAVHSFVDSIDQVLLLIGQKRARKQRDGTHPLGYGMEMYFWSFIVAVMVLLAGGIASVYEGIRRTLDPSELSSPWVSLTVLGIAAAFESSSFAVAFREFKRVVRGRDTPLWHFIRLSKDPSLFATLLEDGAALVGIGLATIGVIGSAWLGFRRADGLASIAIGGLLVGVAAVMANKTRSLIAGEAVAPPVHEALRRTLSKDRRIARLDEIATLHLGPRVILVALTLNFASGMKIADLRDAVREITAALKAIDDRIAYVYVRPPEE
jgi:cation diffusion facilitator family transporter